MSLAKRKESAKTRVQFTQKSYNTRADNFFSDFGQLRLDAIDEYYVPHKFIRIENGRDKSYLVEIERLTKNITDCNAYVQ